MLPQVLLHCKIEYSCSWPEQGDYLGLDLGGTNFRVVLVRFKDGEAETITKYYNLTEECLCGPAAGVCSSCMLLY